MTLKIDQRLQQGRYRIRDRLGQGGMGTVYLAEDLNLSGRLVAIKENTDASPEAQAQFKREAVLLASLNHVNLPRVTDHFIEPNGRQYLVMDYIQGDDLRQVLQNQRAPLPEEVALAWLGQVMDALEYMHTWIDPLTGRPSPIIHRDIKPSNIKRTPDGRIVLVDFGLARFIDGGATFSGARSVTPGYSPLEQYMGGTDIRSDIYALAATLYSMVTLQKPPETPAIAAGTTPLPAPRKLNPKLSRNIERVILRAMQIQPAERYGTVQAMRAALSNRRQTTPVTYQRSMPIPQPARAQRRLGLSIGVTLLVLLLGIGIVSWFAPTFLSRLADLNLLLAPEVASVAPEIASTQMPLTTATAIPSANTELSQTVTAGQPALPPSATVTLLPTPTTPAGTAVAQVPGQTAASLVTDTVTNTVTSTDTSSLGLTATAPSTATPTVDATQIAQNEQATAEAIATALTPPPTATATPVPPTSTPLPTHTAVATPIRQATATETQTPVPTVTVTKTRPPTITSTATITAPPATATASPNPATVTQEAVQVQEAIQQAVFATLTALAPTATPTVLPTQTPVPTLPATATPTGTPTATKIPRPTATATRPPTKTATATFTTTATQTLTPTPSPVPPTLTTAPTVPPTATATPLATATLRPAPTAALPVGGSVTLLEPFDAVLQGKRTFRWSTNVVLAENQYFELVFWPAGNDAMGSGFGPAGSSKETALTIDLDKTADTLAHLFKSGQDYEWGILLVELNPYRRLQYLGGGQRFHFERSSGGGGGGGGGSAPAPTNTPRG